MSDGTHKGYEKPGGAPVTRISSGDHGIEAKLQRAIADTGCTVTECFTDTDGKKAVTVLHSKHDALLAALIELKSQGFRVYAAPRKHL